MLSAIAVVFIAGYLAIAFEYTLKINKAATALLTGVLCWMLYILPSGNKEQVAAELTHHLGGLSQILFFLLGAMVIVELIDAHDGFDLITRRITTRSKRKLIWIICLLTFFLSAVLDNLTTAIVMVSLVRKLMSNKQDRLLFAGAIVIAANAGGAWSPIGDVTTTMLWIGGQITAANIVAKLFLPSLFCLSVPLLILHFMLKGEVRPPEINPHKDQLPVTDQGRRNIVFVVGVAVLLLVPAFKTLTHLPPFMGILFGLGLLWIVIEIVHHGKVETERGKYSVAYALRKIDSPGILFFLGILLAVAALQSAHQLDQLAGWLNATLKSEKSILLCLGLLSSVVDNVPLVAAAMGMYSLQQYPADHFFWEFLAYCTGTGGSVLIIGSAAGVAVMGMEKTGFFWYLKRISWLALLGYFAGAVVYLLQEKINF
jgi:Na+/H+ antiporter NhaD/arsenite permease-like protein